MTQELWIPGFAGPLDEFVHRVHRKIDEFVARRGHEQAIVEVELVDGARYTLHSLSAAPGFGFITLCPYPDDDVRPWPRGDGDQAVPPDEIIVPVASIKRIVLNDAPEPESPLGFTLPPS